MPGLSQAFHAVIRQARALATSRNHDHFILEDIALALTDHDGVKKLVESCGGDVEQLRNDLKARAPVLPPYQANVMLVGGLPMLYPTGRGVLMYHLLNKMQPQPAPSAGRVLQRARSRAETSERPDPGVYELLLSLLHEQDSAAARALADQGITIEAVEDPAAHGVVEEDPCDGTAEPAAVAGSPGGHEDAPLAERMARALEPEMWARLDAKLAEGVPGLELLLRSRENAVRRAEIGLRVLLSALREPSHAVLLAAVQAGTTGGPREAWRAAVDAFAREHGLS